MPPRVRILTIIATVIAGGLSLMIGYLRWQTGAALTPAPAGQESTAGTLDSETARKLLQVVTEQRERLGAPALQVAVVLPDGRWWTGGAGWADPKARRVATADDLYHIGSVSKLYTAALILKLAEEGRLSLEDSVERFVPGIPDGERITVRQLLNHTSGLPNYTESLSFQIRTVLLRHRWTPEEAVRTAQGRRPHFEPGAGHYYSNTNYALLGLIAEQAGGKPFARLLRDRIRTPLRLGQTFFAPQEPVPEGAVRGYDATLLGTGRLGILWDVEGLRTPFESGAFAAGGVVAGARDVSAFTHALFTGGLLQEESLAEMTTFVDAPDPDVPEQTGYGLGVRRLEIGGAELWGHTGIFPGFSNVSVYAPERGYAVTVLSNRSVVDVNRVVEAVQKVLQHQQ